MLCKANALYEYLVLDESSVLVEGCRFVRGGFVEASMWAKTTAQRNQLTHPALPD